MIDYFSLEQIEAKEREEPDPVYKAARGWLAATVSRGFAEGRHVVQGCPRSLGFKLCADHPPGDLAEMPIWLHEACVGLRPRISDKPQVSLRLLVCGPHLKLELLVNSRSFPPLRS